eukprot:gene33596-23056_t
MTSIPPSPWGTNSITRGSDGRRKKPLSSKCPWASVLGGRWKPLQHLLKASAFADVTAACGSEKGDKNGVLCYVRNDLATCCTFPHLLTATDWRDPATYAPRDEPLFAVRPHGAEDPVVWRDRRGGFHALLHDEQGPSRNTAVGRHAYSEEPAAGNAGGSPNPCR